MKKLFVLALAIVMMLSMVASVFASMKTVEFEGKGAGKVIFDGAAHKAKGLVCKDCHTSPKLFAMKKGADVISMKDMEDGKACGACHNGTKAFSVKDKATCAKCHKK
ncbi:MAG: cytochrome C [Nitrospirae bacterium]|nr:cytochrome C [Nitrospirota bacterium]